MDDSSDRSLHDADVILIPVHNRRETTLACLRHLHTDHVMAWATVLVIDDGSTDGTATAIAGTFPEVRLLRGTTGDWWWGGAIRRGMQWALARNARRIYWLNDDCSPPLGGLAHMRSELIEHDEVVYLPALSPSGWRYGGYRRGAWSMRRCTDDEVGAGMIDACNGNCVGFGGPWIATAGLVDDRHFPHQWADFDYVMRLKRHGARIRELSTIVARNGEPDQNLVASWRESPRPAREIAANVLSKRGVFWPAGWWHFCTRHWPGHRAWLVFLLPYFRLVGALTVKKPRATESNTVR